MRKCSSSALAFQCVVSIGDELCRRLRQRRHNGAVAQCNYLLLRHGRALVAEEAKETQHDEVPASTPQVPHPVHALQF